MNKNRFNKVIIWGHKLKDPRFSHTHSFVHEAFYKSFKHMEYDVLWLDNNDDISNINFDNCLFLTEGQVDQKMPVNKTSKYVLHNCNLNKYKDTIENCINLQVYTKDCLSRDVQKLDEPLTYYQDKPNYDRPDHGCDNRTLYQTWATNLLSNEINVEKLINDYKNTKKHNRLYWIGSICSGVQGNEEEISALKKSLEKRKISFVHSKLPNNLQIDAIKCSCITPAIQGKWQVEKGYIPCRVYKNISYGRMCPTNNDSVMKLFDNNLIYSDNIEELVEKSFEWEMNPNFDQLKNLIEEVKMKHTYENRINTILRVL